MGGSVGPWRRNAYTLLWHFINRQKWWINGCTQREQLKEHKWLGIRTLLLCVRCVWWGWAAWGVCRSLRRLNRLVAQWERARVRGKFLSSHTNHPPVYKPNDTHNRGCFSVSGLWWSFIQQIQEKKEKTPDFVFLWAFKHRLSKGWHGKYLCSRNINFVFLLNQVPQMDQDAIKTWTQFSSTIIFQSDSVRAQCRIREQGPCEAEVCLLLNEPCACHVVAHSENSIHWVYATSCLSAERMVKTLW